MTSGPLRLATLATVLLLLAAPGRAGEPAPSHARVWRKESGWVRVGGATLHRLGFADARHVAVTHRGQGVPIFEPFEGDLVFLALDPGGPHSVWGAYDLVALDAPRPEPELSPRPGPADPPTVVARRTLSEDLLYGDVAAAEPSVYDGDVPTAFVARVGPDGGVSIPLASQGAAEGTEQRLEVVAWGTQPGPLALRATWGAHDLGEARAEGPRRAVLSWTVSGDAVPREDALLLLKNASPPAPPAEAFDATDARGTVWVDAISLEGPTRVVADRALRRYPVGEAGVRRVPVPADGGLPLRAWVTTDGAQELVVSAWAEEVLPERVAPAPDPMALAADAEHVIVAVPPLLEGARRLAAHRSAHGLPSAAVPVTAVCEAFAHGERDPAALRAFFDALAARPGKPLRFVLLCGDATFDRTDLVADETIPAPMARSKYNGATASDRLYVEPRHAEGEPPTGGPSIGRLPFREAKDLEAYVDRVIEYETKPPAVPQRRLLRFVTGEGRFNPVIDAIIENRMRTLLAEAIPPAFDVEMTYANPKSPFFWPPPELSSRVVAGLNEGALFLTYVGHGYAFGFDSIEGDGKRWPIFHLPEVAKVEAKGLLPTVFVFACTTGIFDLPKGDGVGEALMKRPRGPVAYHGATRLCHPAANAIFGRALAIELGSKRRDRRLGEILDAARDVMLAGKPRPPEELALRGLLPRGEDKDALPRLYREAARLYALLGDPALVPALPEELEVAAELLPDGRVRATVKGLPDGAAATVSVEATRDQIVAPVAPVDAPFDPASFDLVRKNHAQANDKSLARTDVVAKGGVAEATLDAPADRKKLVVKAWSYADGRVRQGAVVLVRP